MSSISGLSGNSPIQKIVNQPIQKQTPATPATPTSGGDKVELSGISHLMSALKTNDVRTDKVSEIKTQIANGTYDADGKKLDAAINGLLDDLQ